MRRKLQLLSLDAALLAAALEFLLLFCASNAAAQDEHPALNDEIAMLERFVGENTVLVLKVEPSELRLNQPSQDLWSELAESRQSVAQVTRMLQVATGGAAIYATVDIPQSKDQRTPHVFFQSRSRADGDSTYKDLMSAFGLDVEVLGDLVVGTWRSQADGAPSGERTVVLRPELREALTVVAEHPIQILLLPPDYVRRTVRELMPQLPAWLGGGPSPVLTEGVRWAALGVNPAETRVELIVQSGSESAAGRLAEYLPELLQSVSDDVPGIRSYTSSQAVTDLVESLSPQIRGKRVTFQLRSAEEPRLATQLLVTAATMLHDRVQLGMNVAHMKRIVLAMHNYHDRYEVFPPHGSHSGQLSWRVHILPFLDKAELYNQFHLDEPWDSAHNKPLIPKMPQIYQGHPFAVPPGRTTFLAPAGKDTVIGGGKSVSIRDIRDGSSNTIVLVDVQPQLAVPWSAPQDYTFDPSEPGAGLNVNAEAHFLAVAADGSARQLRVPSNQELLLRLFNRDDRQPVHWEMLR